MDTPNYIKALLIPNGNKPKGRKVWSIDLETVWLPFFTSTNVVGDTAIPHDALGSPLRLAYEQDGSVKFSRTGRPVIKVAKDLADSIRMVRENFTASLITFANGVITEMPEGYKAQVELAQKAGEPIIKKDRANLQEALAKMVAEAEAKEQAPIDQAPVEQAPTKAKVPNGNKEKVAVTA